MIRLATSSLILGLSVSSALAEGYVAPGVDVEPVIVEEQPSSPNAGLVVPSLLLSGFVAAIASDDDDTSGMNMVPDINVGPDADDT